MYSLYQLIDREIETVLHLESPDKEIHVNIKEIVFYYKLPYICSYYNSPCKKDNTLWKAFCRSTSIKIVFSSVNLINLF